MWWWNKMADKTVTLRSAEGVAVEVLRGTSVKDSPDINSDTTPTFDMVIPQGSDIIPYTLEVERLVYETREEYEALTTILQSMLKNPGTATTREVVRFKGEEPFVIVKTFNDVLLNGNDYEMKVDEKSAQSLSFNCGSCTETTEDYDGE